MVRIARMLLIALLAFGLPNVAPAQAQVSEAVTFHGLTFPDDIAGAQRSNAYDHEKQRPGLGYGVGYRQSGVVITVYIYDLRMRDIPDDPSAPEIAGGGG